MSANLISKITVGTVFGKPNVEQLLKAKNKQIEMMDVFGLARKCLPDDGKYGEYLKFKGAFKAKNLESGEVFQSGSMILPKVAQEALGGAFSDETKEVQFGFRISVKYDETAVVKYVFVIVPLMAPAENDPLILLENQIAENFKALAAPKADKKAA